MIKLNLLRVLLKKSLELKGVNSSDGKIGLVDSVMDSGYFYRLLGTEFIRRVGILLGGGLNGIEIVDCEFENSDLGLVKLDGVVKNKSKNKNVMSFENWNLYVSCGMGISEAGRNICSGEVNFFSRLFAISKKSTIFGFFDMIVDRLGLSSVDMDLIDFGFFVDDVNFDGIDVLRLRFGNGSVGIREFFEYSNVRVGDIYVSDSGNLVIEREIVITYDKNVKSVGSCFYDYQEKNSLDYFYGVRESFKSGLIGIDDYSDYLQMYRGCFNEYFYDDDVLVLVDLLKDCGVNVCAGDISYSKIAKLLGIKDKMVAYNYMKRQRRVIISNERLYFDSVEDLVDMFGLEIGISVDSSGEKVVKRHQNPDMGYIRTFKSIQDISAGMFKKKFEKNLMDWGVDDLDDYMNGEAWDDDNDCPILPILPIDLVGSGEILGKEVSEKINSETFISENSVDFPENSVLKNYDVNALDKMKYFTYGRIAEADDCVNKLSVSRFSVVGVINSQISEIRKFGMENYYLERGLVLTDKRKERILFYENNKELYRHCLVYEDDGTGKFVVNYISSTRKIEQNVDDSVKNFNKKLPIRKQMLQFSENVFDSFENYEIVVRDLTEIEYMENRLDINPENKIRGFDSRHFVDVYQLDHKFSIKNGFKNRVCPYLMSSVKNLEMLEIADNKKKGKKNSISLKELCS